MILRVALIISIILTLPLMLSSQDVLALEEECQVNDKITTSLNVRNQASAKGEIIGALRRNERVWCDKYLVNLNWVKLNYKGTIGFAHRDYIDFILPESINSPEGTEAQLAAEDVKTYNLPIYYTLFIFSLVAIWLYRQQQWHACFDKPPAEASFLTPSPPEFHLNCFLLSTCFGYSLLIAFGQTGSQDIVRAVAAIIALALYICMQIEGLKSKPYQFLCDLKLDEDVDSYVTRLKEYAPTISWRCECFHFVTRMRDTAPPPVTTPPQQPDPTAEKFEEKQVTWRGHENFKQTDWQDISPSLPVEMKQYQALKVIYAKTYQFEKPETKQKFIIQKQMFESINKDRDESYSFTEELIIQDYKKYLASVVNANKVSPLLYWQAYLLSNALGLSWLHRFWLEYNTSRANYRFTKLLR